MSDTLRLRNSVIVPPGRSIKSDAFKLGSVKPRRYRNHRLGDFLKELELTEGKATGIPRIKKALKENGSPDPFFDFDDDRTFFEVDFYIHPAFKEDHTLSVLNTNRLVNNIGLEYKLNESSEKVLNLVRNNSHITASELAISIGISSRAVEKIIESLKEAGLLERKGSRKTGYWLINDSE